MKKQIRFFRRSVLQRVSALFLILAFSVPVLSGCHSGTTAMPDGNETSSGAASDQTGDRENSSVFEETSSDFSSASDTVSPEVFTPYHLEISEVMASNKTLVGGHNCDFIEIYSGEDTEVSLNGYYLSDDLQRPHRHALLGYTIPADGYAVVRLEKDDAMQLSSDGETVYLFAPDGTLVDSLTYGADIGDATYTKEGVSLYPTPGYANDLDGYHSYLATVELRSGLLISEGMTSNLSYAVQGGETYDWVELYNNSEEPILLSSYYLTDKFKDPVRFQLPETTLNPGESFLVYCSGLIKKGHAPFKLSSAGETVYLTDGSTVLDAMNFPSDLEVNHSYGRQTQNGILTAIPGYLSKPTPGSSNTAGRLFRVDPPTASLSSGIYSGEVLPILSGNGVIHYTVDGSRPTANSPIYSADGTLRFQQNTTLRAICIDGDSVSAELCRTYLIDVSHTLPVVQISLPSSYLSGAESILTNIEQNIEGAGQMTFFVDGVEEFTIPCGFRLHGNDSRNGAKQNFQLRFRSSYGESRLRYPLFEGSDVTEFKSLLLKGGSEDFTAAMLRDELASAIVSDGMTALYAQDFRPVILYLNGDYWGVYYLRERLSADYVASHLDVSAESVDLIAGYGDLQAGSTAAYDALLRYAQNHDLANDTEAYQYVLSQIDEASLMDWYICRTFFGDKDYANIRYFRSTEGDGQWRWMWFDLDWAFYHKNEFPLSQLICNNGRHILLYRLLKNAEFQDQFIRRYAELMETAFQTQRILALIDEIADSIRPEMERDRARWGYTVKKWENCLEQLRNYFRDDKRIDHLKNDLQNFFSLNEDDMARYFR